METFDVAIIGLGVMGSAALNALSRRRGVKVVGIDQFEPGHDKGSSHGVTRIFRLGYFEHPSYVGLLKAVLPMWQDLNARSKKRYGRAIFETTGIVEIGAPESAVIDGTLRASQEHKLAHSKLDAKSLMAKFPAFRVPENFIGVFQPDGGVIRAELTIKTLIDEAREGGADIRMNESVREVRPEGSATLITTTRGLISAGRAIVAAGSWVKSLVPSLPVWPTRQVLGWFEPVDATQAAVLTSPRFPVFILDSGRGIFYGFPADGEAGVKVAKHDHDGVAVNPNDYDRRVSAADEATIRDVIKAHLPGANGRRLNAVTCLYTMTRDRDFILDRLPQAPQIIVASPCSGHGFKFAPLIGEMLADLATDRSAPCDISRFSLARKTLYPPLP